MDFDFYLKVLKNRFNHEGDHTNLNIVLLDVNLTLKKEADSVISIVTPEVKLVIESSEYLFNICNSDFFENHINLAIQNRVVVISDITYTVPDSFHLLAVFELLYSYFHVILIKENEELIDTRLEENSLLLEKVIINNDTYRCYCDPGTIV